MQMAGWVRQTHVIAHHQALSPLVAPLPVESLGLDLPIVHLHQYCGTAVIAHSQLRSIVRIRSCYRSRPDATVLSCGCLDAVACRGAAWVVLASNSLLIADDLMNACVENV